MRKGTLYGKMSNNDRRRSSRRDTKDESRITFETMHDSGKSGLSYHDRETHDWQAAAGNHSKTSSAGPLPGRLGPRRVDNIDEDCNRNLKEITTWEEEDSYGIRMSPGLDYWRQQSHNRSPKNERKRSRRSRSPSQNRSRSRSPIRGFGRELVQNDRGRTRSGTSAQVCKNYASGWCRRGNHCQFLHGQANDESSERQRTPKYPMPHNSRDYPTGSGKSADYCTEFLKGSCRRGSSCRFAHHGSSDMSSDEAIRGRNNDRRQSDSILERHNDRDPRRAAAIPCKFFAAGNCRNGKHCRFSHQDLAFPGPDKSRDGRVSLDRGSADIGKSYTKDEIIGSTKADRSVDDEWGHSLEESEKLGNSLLDDKIAEDKKNEVLPWGNADESKLAFVERESEQWLGDMDMSPEWNYEAPITKPIDKQADNTNWNANEIEQVPMPSETNELYLKPPDQNLPEVGSNDLPLTGLSAVGQGQMVFSNSGVGIRNPEIQMGVQEEKEINKPNIDEPIAPQLHSGVAITQNNVSSEQLSTVSASIAQLLENGQQFEQPYGSLAQNTKETSSFDNKVPYSAMNMPSKQYDPTLDSIEVEKHEISMPKNITNEKPEITSQNKTSADAIERKEADEKSCQVIEGGNSKENNGGVAEENTKVENGPSEKNDDDDEKKGKEAKGVKAFKFALVEFVKELLKPTWKEGQMSKDAYKNIVKKVVEKVTGTMQGPNIPHTQEKIQQYLSTSKPKLTKLVQAYVVKFQKDK